MTNTIENLQAKLDTKTMLTMSLQDWRKILATECQVYVCGENYLARRLDFINFKFCDKITATEILTDNLYLLLRNKYFKIQDDEVDKKIISIVDTMTKNTKSTLISVTFDKENETDETKKVSYLPDYCLAFKNGVYNFKDDKWLFKYDEYYNSNTMMKLYQYDSSYIINWYFKCNFEPLGLDIMNSRISEVVEIFKELSKDSTYDAHCFKLLYNMSHDKDNKFSLSKFEHLCQVLGYTVLGSFSQHFVMLIGSGSNGKNSLFDGCFKNRIYPSPSSVSLDVIEKDRFVTGTLENVSHNIFLETSAKTYTDSNIIKALTGSMYQSVEHKGQNRYSSVINCKYIFAGNDQDNIKFSDNTTGFRRRINVFEIFYQWDAQKKFLKKGDYYDSQFTDDLREFNALDAIEFAYFAMLGIKSATKDFTNNFKFSLNDWTATYVDMDVDLKERIEAITMKDIVKYMKSGKEKPSDIFLNENKRRLTSSQKYMPLYNIYDDESIVKFFSNEPHKISDEEFDEGYAAIFNDTDLYISLKCVYSILNILETSNTFSRKLKKLYPKASFERIVNNNNYVLCTFVNNKLKIVSR